MVRKGENYRHKMEKNMVRNGENYGDKMEKIMVRNGENYGDKMEKNVVKQERHLGVCRADGSSQGRAQEGSSTSWEERRDDLVARRPGEGS